MTTEWTDLPTLQDVAKAQVDGWEIEVDTGPYWEEWKGAAWMNYMTYRGRPRQPVMRKVKMLCWLDSEGELRWIESDQSPFGSIRIPALDIEIEIPEGV